MNDELVRGYQGDPRMYVGNMPYVSRSIPISLNTVIKVIGGRMSFSVEVGGMEVFTKETDSFFTDHHYLRYELTHRDSSITALHTKIRNFLGVKHNPGKREDWVEDFLEIVYPRYNRPGRDMRIKLPVLNKLRVNVGSIGPGISGLEYNKENSIFSRQMGPMLGGLLSSRSQTHEDPPYTSAEQNLIKEIEFKFHEQWGSVLPDHMSDYLNADETVTPCPNDSEPKEQ